MEVIIENLVMVATMLLMLGVGLRTPFSDVVEVLKSPGIVLRGLGANFVAVPLIFYLALMFLPFRPDVVIGLLIMAAVPMAPMGPPFVALTKGKGDVAYSIALMVLIALSSVVLTPLILSLTLPTSESGVTLDSMVIIQVLVVVQLLPVCTGLVLNSQAPKVTEMLLKCVPQAGVIGIAFGVGGVVWLNLDGLLALGLLPVLAVVLGVIVSLVTGAAFMAGKGADLRHSLAISTAVRNIALGILIVNANYASTPAVSVTLLFGIMSMLVAWVYAEWVVSKN
jgi:BASS family bile acid:Na+ symporter